MYFQISLQGKVIPEWQMHPTWPNADDPPDNPEVQGENVKIELIPYGCSRLRIAEFPVLD